MTNIAMENFHRNGEFSQLKWWFSIVMWKFARGVYPINHRISHILPRNHCISHIFPIKSPYCPYVSHTFPIHVASPIFRGYIRSRLLRGHLRQRFVFKGENKGRGQQQDAEADDAEKHRHGKLRLHQAAQYRGVDLEPWWILPSGNLLHSYGKWPFIADFSIENGDFP